MCFLHRHYTVFIDPATCESQSFQPPTPPPVSGLLLDIHLSATTLKSQRAEVNDMDCPTTVPVVVDNPGSWCSCGWYLTHKHNDSDMAVVPQWDSVACHALKTTQWWHEWDLKHRVEQASKFHWSQFDRICQRKSNPWRPHLATHRTLRICC